MSKYILAKQIKLYLSGGFRLLPRHYLPEHFLQVFMKLLCDHVQAFFLAVLRLLGRLRVFLDSVVLEDVQELLCQPVVLGHPLLPGQIDPGHRVEHLHLYQLVPALVRLLT